MRFGSNETAETHSLRGDLEALLDEPEEAAGLREHFRTELRRLSSRMYDNYWDGIELRAIYYNLSEPLGGNVMGWLEKYERKQWDTSRGKFPFDVVAWAKEFYADWKVSYVFITKSSSSNSSAVSAS